MLVTEMCCLKLVLKDLIDHELIQDKTSASKESYRLQYNCELEVKAHT